MENTLIFIDAGFLSKLSRYFGNGKYLKYNIITFSNNLAKKQGLNCKNIFYYTAPPFQNESSNKEEAEKYKKYENFKNALLKNSNIIIREGRCQRLKSEYPKGHEKEFIYNQKGVDALIIIDLMSIPLEHKEVKKIILIANDSDFVPVVEKIKGLGIDVILYTYYLKNRKSSFSRSNHLLKIVSRYIRLTKEDFTNAEIIK